MKYSISAFALALAASAALFPASAADIYTPGASLKDGGFTGPATTGRGGFYATGILGYAWGDRDIRQSIDREAGIYKDIPACDKVDAGASTKRGGGHCQPVAPVEADYDTDEDGTLSEKEQENFDEASEDYADDKKEFDAGLAKLSEAFPGSSFDGSTLTIPLLGDALGNAGNSDIGGFVYGAEVSYLWHGGGRFGLEPAVGVTFYNEDGDNGISHKGAHGTIAYPSNLAGQPVPDLAGTGIDGALGQTGFASAERQMDLDFLLRGYWFVNDRFALTLGGGVSVATAEVCAGNSADGLKYIDGADQTSQAARNFVSSAFNTGGCEDDTSVGPMVEVGAKWWVSDRIAVVGRFDAKWHEFEGDFASAAKVNFAGQGQPEGGIYGKSDNHVSVDDVMMSAKIGVSIKLD